MKYNHAEIDALANSMQAQRTAMGDEVGDLQKGVNQLVNSPGFDGNLGTAYGERMQQVNTTFSELDETLDRIIRAVRDANQRIQDADRDYANKVGSV